MNESWICRYDVESEMESGSSDNDEVWCVNLRFIQDDLEILQHRWNNV